MRNIEMSVPSDPYALHLITCIGCLFISAQYFASQICCGKTSPGTIAIMMKHCLVDATRAYGPRIMTRFLEQVDLIALIFKLLVIVEVLGPLTGFLNRIFCCDETYKYVMRWIAVKTSIEDYVATSRATF